MDINRIHFCKIYLFYYYTQYGVSKLRILIDLWKHLLNFLNYRQQIDGKTNIEITSIEVGNRPTDVSVNPTTNIVYVDNLNNDSISIIGGISNKVIDNVKVGRHPGDLTINPQTNIVYVANIDDNTVSVIDGKTNKAIPILSPLSSTPTSNPITQSPSLSPPNQPLPIDNVKQYQRVNTDDKVSFDGSKSYTPLVL